MKPMHKALLAVIMLVATFAAEAQTNAPLRKNQFSKMSEKLPTSFSELDKAFHAPEGSKLQLRFSNLTFSGIVISSLKRYDNLYSVVIKSSSLDNTLFAISRRTEEDSSFTYVGRIINEKYADGYELRKDDGGAYSLYKIKTEVLIQDY